MALPIFDEALAEAWIACIERGGSIRSASQVCGIHHATVLDHIRNGEADIAAGIDSWNARLSNRYARARGQRQDRWLRIIDSAASEAENEANRISSAKWLLEHCEPNEFGAKAQVELTGRDGGAIQVQEVGPDLSKLTDDELAQYIALREKASGAGSKP